MWLITASLVLDALALSTITTALMRRYAIAKNLMDMPNLRSSHSRPVPRGGGVAIAVVTLGIVAILFWIGALESSVTGAVLLGGGAIAGIGFMDDKWQLSARLRIVVHLAAALLVVYALGPLPERAVPGGETVRVLVYASTVLILIWATNLFNFMDGIDGIAGSEALFFAGAGSLMNWYAGGDMGLTVSLACIGSACLGFLFWNWPPAKIFMGDAGSGFLGFILATFGLAVSQRGTLPLEVWPILGGVFIVDSSLTLVRRMLRGVKWWQPHKSHAYQHAARRFKSHKAITISVTLINLGWLLPWAFAANQFPRYGSLCAVAALIPVAVAAWIIGAGKDG